MEVIESNISLIGAQDVTDETEISSEATDVVKSFKIISVALDYCWDNGSQVIMVMNFWLDYSGNETCYHGNLAVKKIPMYVKPCRGSVPSHWYGS
ncbi:hypothetical protein TNCV_1673601 [Trichonephila clavipes]|nr:hypothetical protein TNCV_1673601 [Trichonephila clavipes]